MTSSRFTVVFAAAVISFTALASAQPTPSPSTNNDDSYYNEKWRPQFHFTPVKAWLSDPNGLTYYNGHYHLFYQHHPFAPAFGPMHWGHAISKDFVHWTHMPIAITPYGKGMIFSGTTVVDHQNLTGVRKTMDDPEPLVAIYTVGPPDNTPFQDISYSKDGQALNFTALNEVNPILPNPGSEHFRDPFVLHYKESNESHYVMILSRGFWLEFYRSDDLVHWRSVSNFSHQGDDMGPRECPSLVKLTTSDGKITKWVMTVSSNAYERGTLTQYYIGEFDGETFVNDNPADVALWCEHGPDNYASIPFKRSPDKRHVIMGWMNNWMYADNLPTSPYRGQMTLPRKMSLVEVEGQLRLAQNPVKELDSLRVFGAHINGHLHLDSRSPFYHMEDLLPKNYTDPLFDIELDFHLPPLKQTRGKVGIQFMNSLNQRVLIYLDLETNQLVFDRSEAGQDSFDPRYKNFLRRVGDRHRTSQALKVRLFVDRSSIEAFFDDGLNVFTGLIFPDAPYHQIKLFVSDLGPDHDAPHVTLTRGAVYLLESPWRQGVNQLL